jgi:uncharacterized protein YqeY
MTHPELKEAIKDAMRAKDATRLSVLRGLSAAATNEAISKGRKGPEAMLTDEELMSVILRASKQRKDSIEQFIEGWPPRARRVRASRTRILMALLPAQMSHEEIVAAARQKLPRWV